MLGRLDDFPLAIRELVRDEVADADMICFRSKLAPAISCQHQHFESRHCAYFTPLQAYDAIVGIGVRDELNLHLATAAERGMDWYRDAHSVFVSLVSVDV